MAGIFVMLVVFGSVGAVSVALIQSGHWITGTALMVLLLCASKIKVSGK